MPLAAKLWDEIRSTAKSYGANHRGSRFFDDLDSYVAFKRDTDGATLALEQVDFEDFMRYLDIEHFLRLRGKDTWSDDGNESTVVVKHLIGKILSRHMTSIDKVPELYLEFARRLDISDTVFTFNYDTLLERALEAVGKPYRLVPIRFKSVNADGSGTIDSDTKEVTILKVHGSIDWFDEAPYERLREIFRQQGAKHDPQDVIFSRHAELQLERVVGSPYPSDDPMASVVRTRNLRALHEEDLLFRATPRLLAPSATKLLYATRLGDFWRGWGSGGRYNYGMSIIGFSLPLHDDYARQILHALVTTYQKLDTGKADSIGITKSPLTIVNYFADNEAQQKFSEHYRFVDWEKTRLFGNGFDFDCLDAVFA